MLLLSPESKAYCFVGVRGVSKAGVALQCAVLCITMVNNLGVICNGILGSKEYPLFFFFFLDQNSSFWNHMKVLMLLPLSL